MNTKILIGIRDELREIRKDVHEHTKILGEHTKILREHGLRLAAVEAAVKDLARQLKGWVAHFDTDYMRLANEVDSMRARLQKCEDRLSPS